MIRDTVTILRGDELGETADWLATWAGPAAVAVVLTVVLSSALTTHWFSWTDNALTDLGHHRVGHAWLFNLGLVASGLLGSVFVARVALQSRNLAHRLGATGLLASTVLLAGMGAFPRETGLHQPVTFGFVAALSYGLLVYGIGDFVCEATRRGVATTWLATTTVTAWGVWVAAYLTASVGPSQGPGTALPQFATLLSLGGFVALSTRRLRHRAGTGSRESGSDDPEPV